MKANSAWNGSHHGPISFFIPSWANNKRILSHPSLFVDVVAMGMYVFFLSVLPIVSAQSTWLRAFCEVGIDYHGSSKPFQNGELRVVGVNF